MNYVIEKKGCKYFNGKYNVGVWCWETEKFPKVSENILKYFNEVWTISEFCKNSISRSIDLPVSVIRLPVIQMENIPYSVRIDRNKYFIVLFTFDYHSIFERKNPLAGIIAFKMAFGTNPNIVLVIKSVNAKYEKHHIDNIKNVVQDHNNIIIIDDFLSKEDTLSLIKSCDVYLSLHRSEGLGLGMREAMTMGRVVIATDYSGNKDYMTDENSILIKYKKIPIPINAGIYWHPEVTWAEPNIYDAVKKLRFIHMDKEYRNTIGTNAKISMLENYNLEKCAKEMISLISVIKDRIQIPRNSFVKKIFDEKYYLDQYPDVRDTIDKKKIKNGETHYMNYGIGEGRSCRWIYM